MDKDEKLNLNTMLFDTKKEITKYVKDIFEQKDQATIHKFVQKEEGRS